MKKILLSCLLGVGIGLNAQTVVFEDSFEGYTDFAIANVGNWTLRDIDLKNTYGIDGVTFANSGVAKSFQVFNSTTTVPATSGTFAARTGNKMMTCFASVASPWNNDWLISPQITVPATGTTKVSFWAKSAHTDYGDEKFQVAVSTNGTAVADFSSISAVVTTPADVVWHEYTYDLSAFAGQQIFIGIHCTSVDQFALSIDDFKVTNTPPATTAPGCTTLNTPANGATGILGTSVNLSWAAVNDASSYDIYLDTNTTPTILFASNVAATSYAATNLAANTTYFWTVIPKNSVGSATGCAVYSFTTKTPNPPGCASNFSPANGATVNSGTVPLSWSAPTTGGAVISYDVYWGTSATSLSKLGTTANTSVGITNVTVGSFYWQIVPINADGAATGCVINSLTAVNPFLPYCGPITYGTVEPITSVNFKYNTANTSAATTGQPAHELFVTKEFKVEQGQTTDISVNSNTGGNYTHFYTVFIDWNNDGDFDDAGESYYTTAGNYFSNKGSTGAGATGIKTKSLAVPANATIGKVRMRIKAIYALETPSAAALANMANSCANTGTAYGQAEDYTIEVVPAGTLAVSSINKSNVSVYPNPFKDVLKISDVKDATSVIVSDVSGRIVAELMPAAELNLSHLNKGVYIVNIKYSNGEVKATKVIKE